MSKFDYSKTDYIDVAQRLAEFRERYPEGAMQPADLSQPYRIETIAGDTYIVVVAAAYRTPDDPRPGIGMAYEAYPGKTPYTKGSELQNAETSAWGRAMVAALAADTRKGVASANEVQNRRAEEAGAERAAQLSAGYMQDLATADTIERLNAVGRTIATNAGKMSKPQVDALQQVWRDRLADLRIESPQPTSPDVTA